MFNHGIIEHLRCLIRPQLDRMRAYPTGERRLLQGPLGSPGVGLPQKAGVSAPAVVVCTASSSRRPLNIVTTDQAWISRSWQQQDGKDGGLGGQRGSLEENWELSW